MDKWSLIPTRKNDINSAENNTFTIEELQNYYVQFTQITNKINEQLSELDEKFKEIEKNEANSKLDSLMEEIKAQKEDYLNNVNFLVAYDQHTYLNLLENLVKKHQQVKEKINPRKKFAFSNKTVNKKEEVKKEDNEENLQEKQKISNYSLDDFKLENLSNETIKVNKFQIENKNNLILENINNCEIYILFAFKAAYIKNVNKSKIYIGSVGGGSLITNLNNSEIYLSTHQLRIHNSNNTLFSVIVTSNPIIEKCTNLIFSELKLKYLDYEKNLNENNIDVSKNKWNNVQDFDWHKQIDSPNFKYDYSNLTMNLNV